MPQRPPQYNRSEELSRTAEELRSLLSRWVRTTREQSGTPRSAQMETLRLLQDEGDATIAALALKRSVKHQSMRLVLEQLAGVGAISKHENPADRRSQVIHITAKGRRLVLQEQQVRTQWIARLLAAHSPEGRKEVAQAIRALNELLDAAIKPTTKPVSVSPARRRAC